MEAAVMWYWLIVMVTLICIPMLAGEAAFCGHGRWQRIGGALVLFIYWAAVVAAITWR